MAAKNAYGVGRRNFSLGVFGATAMGGAVAEDHRTVRPEEFGALADGSTNDCAAIQKAIDSVVEFGGEVRLGAATYNLAGGSLSIPSNSKPVRLVGVAAGVSILKSAGAAPAINIGDRRRRLDGISVERISLVVAADGAEPTGIKAQRTLWLCIRDVEIKTIGGSSGAATSGAIILDGGGDFSAYSLIENVRVFGGFANGVVLRGHNAALFLGGSFVRSTPSGSKRGCGLSIQDGGTNTVIRTDFAGWQAGVELLSTANSNWLACRCEANGVDWVVEESAADNSFWGASFRKYSDKGKRTIYLSAANGAVSAARLANLSVNQLTFGAETVATAPRLSAAGRSLLLDGDLVVDGQIRITGTTPPGPIGSVVAKIEVFDKYGHSLGFVPIYK